MSLHSEFIELWKASPDSLRKISIALTNEADKYFSEYESLRPNTQVFAETGGGGVHFSTFYTKQNSFPVVMTVPEAGVTLPLSRSFEDFFSLGAWLGFGYLEELVWDKSAFSEEFNNAQNLLDSFPEKVRKVSLPLIDELSSKYHCNKKPDINSQLSAAEKLYDEFLAS